MRIVHFITRRELRGAEVVAADLCEALAARGHETALVGLYRAVDNQGTSALRPCDVNLCDLNGWRKGAPDPHLLWRVIRKLKQLQPDLVQANAFHALKFTSLAKRLTRARWPLVYRNVGIASRWVRRPRQIRWGRWLLRNVDHVLSVSEASRTDFQQTFGVADSMISISHQGVVIPDRPSCESVRSDLVRLAGCNAQDSLVLHVGNFSPEKNHLGLLQAFELLAHQRPDARLILIGDGPLRSRVEQHIHHRNLQARVHLLGARRDAGRLVAGADVVALASLIEGIPGVVLEAAAQGIAVVGTDVGGMREIVIDGVTGRLVTSGDMPALADAMNQLLQQPERRRQMGAAAREFVRREHEQTKTVDAIEQLYRRLTSMTNAPTGKWQQTDRVDDQVKTHPTRYSA